MDLTHLQKELPQWAAGGKWWVTYPLLLVLGIRFLVLGIHFLWTHLHEPIAVLLRSLPTPEQKERIRLRQQFAEGVLSENQSHYPEANRFTDLEADFYPGNPAMRGVGGRRQLRLSLSLGPRRVKTLAGALIDCKERFVLVEGDPGSGKSVLLREIVTRVCQRVLTSRSLRPPIALYFNLKKLDRQAGVDIDASLIHEFMLKQMRAGRKEIPKYLDEHFGPGIRTGGWLFLLDSFDEIPDILSSQDTSNIIDRYAQAIADFASDMNGCRIVLATRHFRRPRDNSRSKFRLLPLSDKQRAQLIESAKLSPEATGRLYASLASAGSGLRYISENPMYFNMLIDYAGEESDAPNSAHELFAHRVKKRFNKDEKPLRSSDVDSATLRAFAERVAFTMTAESNLGLNPRRKELLSALESDGPQLETHRSLLDLLEQLNIARGEPNTADPAASRFTFSHRRFQEYFATSYVLQHRGSLQDRDLLFNARWRETTGVMLVTQADAAITPILDLAKLLMMDAGAEVRRNGQYVESPDPGKSGETAVVPNIFVWPADTRHVLSLLQDGFADNPARLPAPLRAEIAGVVRSAFCCGWLPDWCDALEVAGTLTARELIPLLRSAVPFGSQLLDDIAFRQMRSLESLPEDLSSWLRLILVQRATMGDLRRNRRTLEAFLSRIRDGGRLWRSAKLLVCISPVDDILLAGTALVAMAMSQVSLRVRIAWAVAAIIGALVRHVVWRIYPWSVAMGRRRMERAFDKPRWAGWIYRLPPYNLTVDQQARLQLYVGPFFLVLFIRLVPAMIILPVHTVFAGVAVFGWVLVNAWAPMATLAALQGRFTSPHWWPFLSFFPALRFFANPLESVRDFRSHGAKYLLFGMLYIVTAGFIGGLTERYRPAAVLLALTICMSLAGYLMTLAIFWSFDWRRLQRSRDSTTTIASTDFLGALGRYRFNSLRARFVQLVASDKLLAASERSIEIVRALGLALNRDLARKPHEPYQPTGCASVDDWRRHYSERRWRSRKSGLKHWGARVLDEVSRLHRVLEDVHRLAQLRGGGKE